MNANHREPDDEFVIHDLETLKVMADPLRLQILDVMLDRVCTVKQIAADLNIAPTKLYYHFKQLEEHGLICVVDTRLVSGIVEKLYQASAYNYRVDRTLLSPGTPGSDENLNQMLSTLFDGIRDDIRQSIQAGVIKLAKPEQGIPPDHHDMVVQRGMAHMSPERAEAFYARVRELLAEFNDDEGQENEQLYTLFITLYPTARHKPAG